MLEAEFKTLIFFSKLFRKLTCLRPISNLVYPGVSRISLKFWKYFLSKVFYQLTKFHRPIVLTQPNVFLGYILIFNFVSKIKFLFLYLYFSTIRFFPRSVKHSPRGRSASQRQMTPIHKRRSDSLLKFDVIKP